MQQILVGGLPFIAGDALIIHVRAAFVDGSTRSFFGLHQTGGNEKIDDGTRVVGTDLSDRRFRRQPRSPRPIR